MIAGRGAETVAPDARKSLQSRAKTPFWAALKLARFRSPERPAHALLQRSLTTASKPSSELSDSTSSLESISSSCDHTDDSQRTVSTPSRSATGVAAAAMAGTVGRSHHACYGRSTEIRA